MDLENFYSPRFRMNFSLKIDLNPYEKFNIFFCPIMQNYLSNIA